MRRIFASLAFLALASCSGVTTEIYNPQRGEGMYILTPKASETPQINSATLFGVRPLHPFLYTIAATGSRPIEFSVEGLPDGLTLNPNTGVISGTIISNETKSYNVVLKAKNNKGEASQDLEIVVGEQICLTPPLGWNSWNCWGHAVTQENVEASAKAMYDKGLVDFGWNYINIDDGWQGNYRGGEFGGIMPDSVKFPSMQQMCDNIHAMGMKVGIYSTPWITSYAKYIGGSSNNKDGKWDVSMKKLEKEELHGKYKFDTNDANQWAAWGMDYLKYDWNPNDAESTIRMAKALRSSGRDIVFSLSNTCPKDMKDVCMEYVQVWRTTGDLKDRWDQPGNHKNICDVWPLHREWVNDVFEGTSGHYADPDMLVVGHMDRGWNKEMTPSTLTADEQYSHIALWSLWSAPLLIGCPIEKMDDFTVALLSNREVLQIQQDRFASPGKSVVATSEVEIIVKELYNGDKAVGIFNLGTEEGSFTVDWNTVGVTGVQKLRDAWRQTDIGKYKDSFTAVVPSHGNVLFVMKAQK
ncbi:MAG: putative Ig domain-containing protein [Rikenellaceae bacterium]